MKIKVKDNQNIVDLAIQYYGSVEGLKQLISDNPSLRIDEAVEKETVLMIDETKIVNQAVFDHLKKEKLIIATGAETNYAGGFWITEDGGFVTDENGNKISLK